MDDVLNNLEGRFSWLAGKEDVKARVSFTEESIEIDLGNDKWESIRIDKTGWAIGPHKTKLFRTKSMYPLPEPISDKNKLVLIKDLFRLSDDDYKLIVGWLIGCFMPKGPYPILILQGEQGSGKSTLARVLRTIIDPSNTPTTSFPNKEQDLYIQARHNRILSYDNQRKLSNIHSDWLCRISTGGGYSNRKLYTDSDEIEMNYTRPIILNGIHSIASQSDLISRAIIINLTEISDSRMQEKDLWQIFEENKVCMLGELCDGVVSVLNAHEPDVKLGRMADFIIWVTKAEEAFGWDNNSFQKAYERNKKGAIQSRLEFDPLCMSQSEDISMTTL